MLPLPLLVLKGHQLVGMGKDEASEACNIITDDAGGWPVKHSSQSQRPRSGQAATATTATVVYIHGMVRSIVWVSRATQSQDRQGLDMTGQGTRLRQEAQSHRLQARPWAQATALDRNFRIKTRANGEARNGTLLRFGDMNGYGHHRPLWSTLAMPPAMPTPCGTSPPPPQPSAVVVCITGETRLIYCCVRASERMAVWFIRSSKLARL